MEDRDKGGEGEKPEKKFWKKKPKFIKKLIAKGAQNEEEEFTFTANGHPESSTGQIESQEGGTERLSDLSPTSEESPETDGGPDSNDSDQEDRYADAGDENEESTTASVSECESLELPQDAKYKLVYKLVGSDDVVDPTTTPKVYRLPTEVTYEDETKLIRKCIVGMKPEDSADMMTEEKIILTVGATGAGKTTLVNGIINYALGVDWNDPFRFQIIADKDERRKERNQSVSQTTWVTAYTLYPGKGNRIPYILTIIDTPGFGDTQGLKKDEELLQKLRSLFESQECGIDCLHGVCFVAQSSLARLTPCQKYVFDGVLSIFGKDVGENIFMLLTFADAMPPPVVDAIKEAKLRYREFFKFNNSSLFADNAEETPDRMFNEMFWKMGFSSFERFFTFLFTKISPVSLHLTVSVLEKRERLQVYIAGLQENIKKGICTLNEIEQEKLIVKDRERDINRNKDFWYKVKEEYAVKVDKAPGQHVTNCQFCNRTCHTNCVFSNDEDKRRCSAMDKNGYCKVCQPEGGDKCIWSIHYNMQYYFTWHVREVKKKADDLFEKYELARGEKLKAEKLIEKINQRFDSIQAIVLAQTNEVRKCLVTLSEIALKPNPLTTVDYIDQMISAEKMSAEAGWQERVQQLEHAKQKAEYLQKLSGDDFDPFDEARRQCEDESENDDGDRTVTTRGTVWWNRMATALGGLIRAQGSGDSAHDFIEMQHVDQYE